MADETNVGGPLQCPRFSVNGFQVLASPTEFTLLCISQVAGVNSKGEIEAGSLPAVQLGFSPAVAKELALILDGVVKNHESENGEITTPFLRLQQEK